MRNKIHDTNNDLDPDEKKILIFKAESIEKKIRYFFQSNPGIHFTSEDIQSYLNLTECPLTSIRRSLSNLYNDGYILKDNQVKKMGKYGVSICTYFLKLNNNQISISFNDDNN